jgi:hypothetical protein
MLATQSGRRSAATLVPGSAPMPSPERARAESTTPAADANGAALAARIDTGGRLGEASAPPCAAADPPALPAPAWCEIGRAGPDDALWIAWMAPLGDRGATLYRSLVVANSAIVVSVEMDLPPGNVGGTRPVHSGRCGMPPGGDARGVEERAALLLAAADRAVARAVGASGPIGGVRLPTRPADNRGGAQQPRA